MKKKEINKLEIPEEQIKEIEFLMIKSQHILESHNGSRSNANTTFKKDFDYLSEFLKNRIVSKKQNTNSHTPILSTRPIQFKPETLQMILSPYEISEMQNFIKDHGYEGGYLHKYKFIADRVENPSNVFKKVVVDLQLDENNNYFYDFLDYSVGPDKNGRVVSYQWKGKLKEENLKEGELSKIPILLSEYETLPNETNELLTKLLQNLHGIQTRKGMQTGKGINRTRRNLKR